MCHPKPYVAHVPKGRQYSIGNISRVVVEPTVAERATFPVALPLRMPRTLSSGVSTLRRLLDFNKGLSRSVGKRIS